MALVQAVQVQIRYFCEGRHRIYLICNLRGEVVRMNNLRGDVVRMKDTDEIKNVDHSEDDIDN